MNVNGPLEVVAQRMNTKTTQLIVDGGDRRWRVTVAVAHDHRNGHAIGFRHWISPATVYPAEDVAIAAALADITVLAETEATHDPSI